MSSKKIWILDDDGAILDSLSVMLDFEGFEVRTFERGSQLFEQLEALKKPNGILLDMWLVGEDGRDICADLKTRAETKDIPVIMMSASGDMAHSALEAGADAFVSKPFDIDELITEFEALIDYFF